MRKMNAAFDLDKRDAKEIAQEFLTQQNLLSSKGFNP
jgi:glycine betaine/choline ABC-type transport system substrate-binding protein